MRVEITFAVVDPSRELTWTARGLWTRAIDHCFSSVFPESVTQLHLNESLAVLHDADGREHRDRGEMHISWVLEGRAMQDLFIIPPRAGRSKGTPARGDRYGTTIRTFDRKLNAWRVNFINPADDETSAELIARREGQGIMMEGKLRGGATIRWRYHTITPMAFHYTAEKLKSDDNSWHLYLELFGKRSTST